MTRHSLFPEKYHILSGSMLKVLAMVTMLIDHTAFILQPVFMTPIPLSGERFFYPYTLMRLIGRLAFPLFCFLLVEGFLHTSDRKKYALRLFAFALISEIPWNLAHGAFFYAHQNVYFTLLLGYLGIWTTEHFQKDRTKMALFLLGLLTESILLDADYGVSGFGFILCLYLLRNHALGQALVGSCLLPSTWQGGLAFIPINLYNGKRGFIRGKAAAYCFYAFYPLHILALYFLRLHLGY